MYTSSGLGATSQQITSQIGGGLMMAGGTIGKIPGGQIPGAIVAGAGLLTALIGSFFKPDLTKIEATRIVDRIELEVLKPNLAAWEALAPEQKTASVQAAALANFDNAWSAVLQGCGKPQLGNAGVACIADRSAGGQFPWGQWYRDPIANDPDVQPDPIAALFSGGFESGSAVPLLLIGGLLLWAVAS